jgi:hypothetical protein
MDETICNNVFRLFRVKDAGLTRFISKEAKEAIEAADLKGIHFVRLIAS